MSDAADRLFALALHPRDDGMCVVLAGELDLAVAGRIERETAALFDAGCAIVEIDLSGLEFIDSSGVHELLRCRDLATAHDARLRLRVAPGAVHRALAVCAVLDQFEVEMQGP
jgi:anti-sigma B factor antagonist